MIIHGLVIVSHKDVDKGISNFQVRPPMRKPLIVCCFRCASLKRKLQICTSKKVFSTHVWPNPLIFASKIRHSPHPTQWSSRADVLWLSSRLQQSVSQVAMHGFLVSVNRRWSGDRWGYVMPCGALVGEVGVSTTFGFYGCLWHIYLHSSIHSMSVATQGTELGGISPLWGISWAFLNIYTWGSVKYRCLSGCNLPAKVGFCKHF